VSLTLVHTALRAQAVSALGSMVVEHQNAPVVKPTNAKWGKFFFRPNKSSVRTLGSTGTDEHDGFFQIDVNYPVNTGDAASEVDYEALKVKFNASVNLTSGTQVVMIEGLGMTPDPEETQFYKVIFTVYWRAQVARSG
jgi:hypothetical protein